MKLKRLFSGALVTVLITSTLSYSAFANINERKLQIGFQTGMESWDSNEFDFLDEPYSLTSGDYYMGLSVENASFTYRGSIGDTSCNEGKTVKNIYDDIITGINSYCSWAHLYQGGYALITKDKHDFPLKAPVIAFGPTGIFFEENEGKSGIKEYAQIHDAKIKNNGTYTVGIQGFNWKRDTATTSAYYGNGFNRLSISSNIKSTENDVTIKNPVLKLYNSKESYEAKKPDKTILAGYWISKTNDTTGYVEFNFVNVYDKNESYKDKKYYNHQGGLDVFGLSGYTGAKSDMYQTGYEGCTYLPEYAIELTFDVNLLPIPTTNKSVNRIKTTAKPTTAPTKPTKPVVKTKKATIKKLTPKKKALKVIWKKVIGAKGYEIKLATNKKFTKNKKTVKVKKGSATSKTIKKLKSGKKYYVKIRAYKKVKIDGYTVTANGPWSKVKSKKVK